MRKSPVDISELVGQYLSGQSLGALSAYWHSDRRTLIRHLRKAGVTLRSPGESRSLTAKAKRAVRVYPTAEILAYYAGGANMRQCEAKFHLHHYTLMAILKAAQVYRTRSEAKRQQLARLSPEAKRLQLAPTRQGYQKWLAAGGMARRRKPKRKSPPGGAG